MYHVPLPTCEMSEAPPEAGASAHGAAAGAQGGPQPDLDVGEAGGGSVRLAHGQALHHAGGPAAGAGGLVRLCPAVCEELSVSRRVFRGREATCTSLWVGEKGFRRLEGPKGSDF